ncbi:MAG: hypothetical protein ACIAQU_08145 [Phycisphaerales bacterium JB064]
MIDHQVAELARLLQSLNGTLSTHGSDRRTLNALLGRIDMSMAELRHAVDALGSTTAATGVATHSDRVFRFDEGLFNRSRADRRA